MHFLFFLFERDILVVKRCDHALDMLNCLGKRMMEGLNAQFFYINLDCFRGPWVHMISVEFYWTGKFARNHALVPIWRYMHY
jgi:hypothetical protein